MLPLSIGIKFAIPNCLMNKMSGLLRGTSEKTYEEQYTLCGRNMAGRSPGKLRAPYSSMMVGLSNGASGTSYLW
jgi:hypothetical protein